MISLDIYAAFDTINHGKLLSRLRDEFGVTDMALKWLKSYIGERHQFVKLDRHSSATVRCTSGVPHRSVLAHWFSPCTFRRPVRLSAAMVWTIINMLMIHSSYYIAIRASTISSDLCSLETCSQAAKHWFADNDLLLNADKSEAMFVG